MLINAIHFELDLVFRHTGYKTCIENRWEHTQYSLTIMGIAKDSEENVNTPKRLPSHWQ